MGLIAFSLGSVPIYLYGLVVVLAVLLGMLTAWVSLRLRGESFAPVVDLMLWGLPVGFVFARMGYVVSHWGLYEGHWQEVFCLWQGGISFYGGAIGFLLVLFVYCNLQGLDVWYWLDVLIPAFLVGIAVNELGNFATQMTVGMPFPPNIPNDHTLAEYIEFRYRPSGFENYEYFHPVALYQMGLQLVALLMVSIVSVRSSRRWRLQTGCIFALGMFLVALIRFGCGFVYLSTEQGFCLHMGQIFALGTAVLAMLLFLWRRRTGTRGLYRMHY